MFLTSALSPRGGEGDEVPPSSGGSAYTVPSPPLGRGLGVREKQQHYVNPSIITCFIPCEHGSTRPRTP